LRSLFALSGHKRHSLQGAGGAFFTFGAVKAANSGELDWKYLRDRWEYSHVARAGLAIAAFVLLATAVIGAKA